MNTTHLITQLDSNYTVFQSLFTELSPEEYCWKPTPEKWCMLEIICHLYDEEREDFRTRLRYVLETPEQPLPSFNPVTWVTERKYMAQNYAEKVQQFLAERKNSVEWLRALKKPKWNNIHNHPQMGPLSAHFFLANWLAHDYLHIRQINRLRYAYLQEISGQDLRYAGNWEA